MGTADGEGCVGGGGGMVFVRCSPWLGGGGGGTVLSGDNPGGGGGMLDGCAGSSEDGSACCASSVVSGCPHSDGDGTSDGTVLCSDRCSCSSRSGTGEPESL
jgi:hypothetical protein